MRRSSSKRCYAPAPSSSASDPLSSKPSKRDGGYGSQAATAAAAAVAPPPPPPPPPRPPSPRRKRHKRRAAAAAEASIRQQLQRLQPPSPAASFASSSQSVVSSSSSPHQPLQHDAAAMVDDESPSSSTSALLRSRSPLHLSLLSPFSPTLFQTPAPKRGRRRGRAALVSKPSDSSSSAVSSSTSVPTATAAAAANIITPSIPIRLARPLPSSPPPLRPTSRILSRLPKTQSSPCGCGTQSQSPSRAPLFPSSTSSPSTAAVSLLRSQSAPSLHPPHPIFFDPVVLSHVCSLLPLACVLRFRSLNSHFRRASLYPHSLSSQQLLVASFPLLLAVRPASLKHLPALTINGQTFPVEADVEQPIARLLSALGSGLRRVRLLNLARLSKEGLKQAISGLRAVQHLELQNCLGLGADAAACLTEGSETAVGKDSKKEAKAAARGSRQAASSSTSSSSTSSSSLSSSSVQSGYSPSTLRSLDLSKWRLLSNSSLKPFHAFSSLTALNLRGCRELTDGCMQYLAPLRLTALDLSFCTLLTDLAVAEVASKVWWPLSSSLTSLSLVSLPRLTDASLRSLSMMRLRCLDVSWCEAVTDDGVLLLARGACGRSLTELRLSFCCRLTGELLVRMAELRTADEEDREEGMNYDDSNSEQDEQDSDEPQHEVQPQQDEEEEDEEGNGEEEADAGSSSRSPLSDSDEETTTEEDWACLRARRIMRLIRRKRRAARAARTGTAWHAENRDQPELWSSLCLLDVSFCRGIDNTSKALLIRARPLLTLRWKGEQQSEL